MKNPWLKFYPTDWSADERLGTCGLVARGLWIEMIGLMHRADPYGHMLVNGKKPSDDQLAALVRAPVEIVRNAVAELDAAGVFSRTRNGTIYSRRMTKDEKKSREGMLSQRAGGPLPGSRRSKQVIERTVRKQTTLEVVDGVADQPPPSQRLEASIYKEKEQADFERFWKAWPLKVKRDEARKAFSKAIGRARVDDILAGMNRYIANKPDWQHWAHASTWLNGGRWSDEPDSKASDQSTLPIEDITTSTWRVRVGSYRRTGLWPGDIGPPPGDPRCEAPAHLLVEFGAAA